MCIKDKVLTLPKNPGVYIMKDNDLNVLYVGKAKNLKNRVSQYFMSSINHSIKTKKLVSQIYDFEIIITGTEFEALVLESSLIKKYQPKYNILLKDDKGYPFISITTDEDYPEFKIVSKSGKDTARYFGPYSSRSAAKHTIDVITQTLKLKTCKKVFPRDIRKNRPCLNYDLGKCLGICRGDITKEEYRGLIEEAILLLRGKDKNLVKVLEEKMYEASEKMQFENAALIRDRIRAIAKLYEKQNVISKGFSDTDVLSFCAGQRSAVVVVLHYINGNLQSKESVIVDGADKNDEKETIEGFIKQYYSLRGVVPRNIITSCRVDEQIEIWFSKIFDRTVKLSKPQRGFKKQICDIALQNASDEVQMYESRAKTPASLEMFAKMAGLDNIPNIIEAYDISNTSGHETVGSMVVFKHARPKKSCYRKFKINTVQNGQDDYKSMREMLVRRIQRFKQEDRGFCPLPDVFLIDGGLGHVKIAYQVMNEFGLQVPVFGMVKDDRHRTRGLVCPDGRELGISNIPILFTLIGNIQEEAHRFAVEYHRKLRGNTLKVSVLDKIDGIGQTKKSKLLREFKSIKGIKEAKFEHLCFVVGTACAHNIIKFFEENDRDEDNKR